MTKSAVPRHDLGELRWTKHALSRGQERSISEDAALAAIWFGHRYWAGDGLIAYYLGSEEVRQTDSHIACSLERYTNIAVIVAPDGAVVSVQHARRPKRRWQN